MLFDDTFEVNNVDPDGKKFDKVSRIYASGENYNMSLILDYNCDIYSLKLGQLFNLKLCNTLNYDRSSDGKHYNQDKEKTLLDDCEYCMYGTVFKIEADENNSQLKLYISFGGLIMCLIGQSSYIQKISLDDALYLLISKRS